MDNSDTVDVECSHINDEAKKKQIANASKLRDSSADCDCSIFNYLLAVNLYNKVCLIAFIKSEGTALAGLGTRRARELRLWHGKSMMAHGKENRIDIFGDPNILQDFFAMLRIYRYDVEIGMARISRDFH